MFDSRGIETVLEFFRACVLGIIQGVTEFFPVSSSGHVAIVPELFGWKEFTSGNSGLAFSAVLHLGTLFAICVFFRSQWVKLIKGFFSSFREKPRSWDQNQKHAWLLVLATIPAAVSGFFLSDFVEEKLGKILMVGLFLACGAILMAIAEVVIRRWSRRRTLSELNIRDSLVMGIFQVFALAPGLSRSGATISGGVFSGLDRDSAASFSFLMLAPISFGAGSYKLFQMLSKTWGGIGTAALTGGFLSSAISGLLAVRFLLRFLRRGTLTPFIFYSGFVACATIIFALLRG